MSINEQILVVDDVRVNLHLLAGLLTKAGYSTRCACDGQTALESARGLPPDLILLDVSMPDMDGYEVCRQLKADGVCWDIPVIFLSAMNETADKVRGFAAGGVDYITKPFDSEEVKIRVATHLKLRRLQKQLQEYGADLETMVERRTAELAKALRRLEILDRTKTDFLALISHELRTPLNGLIGIAELALDDPSGIDEFRSSFEHSKERILGLLDDALLLSQLSAGAQATASESIALDELLSQALEGARRQAKLRGVELGAPGGTFPTVAGKPELLVRATRALLEVATTFARAGSCLEILTAAQGGMAEIVVCAKGQAIPPQVFERFFEVLAVSENITIEGDLGLRPAVARNIIALHGGEVRVENTTPPGIRFVTHLPVADRAASAIVPEAATSG